MNDGLPPKQETHRTFLLMNQTEKGEALSQRELASRLVDRCDTVVTLHQRIL